MGLTTPSCKKYKLQKSIPEIKLIVITGMKQPGNWKDEGCQPSQDGSSQTDGGF